MKIIFFQSAVWGEDESHVLIEALAVMGLKRDEDYLLVFNFDHDDALAALSAGQRQLFFSSVGSSSMYPDERCALVKDLNPDAFFVTLSIYLPNEQNRTGLDGWLNRPHDRKGAWLPLQLAIHDFLSGMPREEFNKKYQKP